MDSLIIHDLALLVLVLGVYLWSDVRLISEEDYQLLRRVKSTHPADSNKGGV